MKTPAQYQHEVDDLDLDGILHTEGVTGDQAQQTLETLRAIQEKLRQMETNLNLEIHALRAQYQGRAAALNVQNARRSGRKSAEDGQRLEDERESKLTPYEEVRKKIEEALQRVDQARGQLESSG